MNIIAYTDKIWTIEKFLSPQYCEDLISLSESNGYQEATVSLPEGARMMKGIRNNDRYVYNDPKLAMRLFNRLEPALPIMDGALRAQHLNARFRFYRYGEHQRFKRHIDGRVKRGSQESRLTFMIYLNTDFTGGETQFDDVIIHPKIGMALLFLHEQKHESLAIETGRKYVLRSDVFYAKHEESEGA